MLYSSQVKVKTFEQKVQEEATKQWLERYSVYESFRAAKTNAEAQAKQVALATVAAERKAKQDAIDAQREAEKKAIVAAGGVVFKADAPKSYRPTKKQYDFAGKLAREIRDSGATNNSAHSLSKYFTIDTLIAMRDAIKAGKTIVVEL